MDQAEIQGVAIDYSTLDPGTPTNEADEFRVTFKLLGGELLDTTMAILGDDIQLISS